MPAYVIAKLTIANRETYSAYSDGFMEIFMRHGGKLLAVDEAPDVIEGAWPYTRTVLLEFADKAAMRSWYDSREYQALAQHRFAASTADIVLIEGFTPPPA